MAKTAEQMEWTPKRLRKAVAAGTNAEKVALLRETGAQEGRNGRHAGRELGAGSGHCPRSGILQLSRRPSAWASRPDVGR